MISSASSVLRPRVAGSRCMASHSGPRGLPMPNPGSMRPPESTSMVAHCLASSTGSRIAAPTTFTPNLIRRVRPAIAARAVMHSRIGVRLTRRSLCQIESTPPCSHRSTQRQKPDAVRNGYSIRPIPAAMVRGMPSVAACVRVDVAHDVQQRLALLYQHRLHRAFQRRQQLARPGDSLAVAARYLDKLVVVLFDGEVGERRALRGGGVAVGIEPAGGVANGLPALI